MQRWRNIGKERKKEWKVNCEEQETNGISLIALVVTIVILIILATISLNLLFNKNGIIKQAQLAKEIQANTIDLENEHGVAWLCDPDVWNNNYKIDQADYAIGSPSVEMYMKAYNVWKTGNKDATNLICKVEGENGYSVGANNSYRSDIGYVTDENAIESGPKNIFMTSGENYWWLASPSVRGANNVSYINGFYITVSNFQYGRAQGVCPIVSL